MDIHRSVALTSSNAAKLYGLYPRKGTIAIGSDADLAIWDPEREVTMSVDILHDEMDYTPYEGTKVTGWPVVTLLRGATICREFEFLGTEGAGRFLRCVAPDGGVEGGAGDGVEAGGGLGRLADLQDEVAVLVVADPHVDPGVAAPQPFRVHACVFERPPDLRRAPEGGAFLRARRQRHPCVVRQRGGDAHRASLREDSVIRFIRLLSFPRIFGTWTSPTCVISSLPSPVARL